MLPPNNESVQLTAFEQAKKSLGEKLSIEMRTWSYSKMKEELRNAIRSTTRPGNSSALRGFARQFLGLRGDKGYKTVTLWLKGERPMTAENITSVFNALTKVNSLRDGQAHEVHATEHQRHVVEHTIVVMNSCVRMMKSGNLEHQHIFGSERMELKKALREISSTFGIEAVFRDSPTVFKRVTMEDLSGIPSNNKSKK